MTDFLIVTGILAFLGVLSAVLYAYFERKENRPKSLTK